MSLALNIERPELEEQSVKLASEAEQLNLQLAEIEQVLLNVSLHLQMVNNQNLAISHIRRKSIRKYPTIGFIKSK